MASLSNPRMRLGIVLLGISVLGWPAVPGLGGQASRQLARVSGIVFDSLASAPLPGADVQLLPANGTGRARDAVTNAEGRFVVTDVDSGTYLVGAFHPRLDSLGIELPPVEVHIAGSDPVEMNLAVPSRRAIVASFCPDSVVHDGTTVLTGSVRDAATGAPRSSASVLVNWGELAIDGGGLANVQRGGPVQVGPTGRFVVCNIPGDAALTARAAAGPDTSGAIDFSLPATGILARDLFVPASQTPAPAGVDPNTFREAVLRGRVVTTNGAPVPEARVAVWGTPGEVRTNARGEFAMADLPGGTTSVAVKAVGFDAQRVPIDLRSGPNGNTLNVTLTRSVTTLATVSVLETADIVLSRTGFTKRAAEGMGRYLDGDAIAKSSAIGAAALISRFPGTQLKPASRGNRLFMRDNQGLACPPTVWVDGQRLDSSAEADVDGVIDIDFWVDYTRLAGIEVYVRANEAPLQYGGTNKAACGVIVIWHRVRPAPRPQ